MPDLMIIGPEFTVANASEQKTTSFSDIFLRLRDVNRIKSNRELKTFLYSYLVFIWTNGTEEGDLNASDY